MADTTAEWQHDESMESDGSQYLFLELPGEFGNPVSLRAWGPHWRSGKFYWTSGIPGANPPQAVDTIDEAKAAAISDYTKWKETYT